MIQHIAFDYGRTLYDRENDDFFPDALPIIEKLQSHYHLHIVSYSRDSEITERMTKLRESKLDQFFTTITFFNDPEKKDEGYEKIVEEYSISPSNLGIVDDYIIRGINWGFNHGACTFWFKNGKFASIDPSLTGVAPTHIIHSLSDLNKLLLNQDRS